MTDQTPMDGFETRVTALVRSYTEPAAKPIDPVLDGQDGHGLEHPGAASSDACGRSATTDAWPGCSSWRPSS